MERTDWDLIRDARRGNEGAFRELFDRYHRQILALAIGMTGNRDDAFDVVQDTFVKAYQKLDKFHGDAGFYTWLYRIAVNVAIDHRRSEQRRRNRVDGERETEDLAAESSVEPDSEHARRELRARLADVIDELTPEHKAAIVLREIEGLSYEDISRVMECSKGTVMSRLHYARKKLQARLKDLL